MPKTTIAIATLFAGAFFGVGPLLETQRATFYHPVVSQGVVKGVTTDALTEAEAEADPTPVSAPRLPVVEAPVRSEDYRQLRLPTAEASLIVDVASGEILHNQNDRKRRSVASLTKLATALMVIEEVPDLDALLTFSTNATNVEGTKVGCPTPTFCYSERATAGEQITVRDALHALLIVSANDAAVALAEHVSGSEAAFVSALNERMEELGLHDTNFCRASGLEFDGREQECYSTAYDMAQVMRTVVTNDRYAVLTDIMQTGRTTITGTSGTDYLLITTNRLYDAVPGLLGAKTGNTPAAGQSFMLATTDADGVRPIVLVELGNLNRWRDAQTMIRWAHISHTW